MLQVVYTYPVLVWILRMLQFYGYRLAKCNYDSGHEYYFGDGDNQDLVFRIYPSSYQIFILNMILDSWVA